MAYNADSSNVQWVCPEMRGQISLETMHISRQLKKIVRQGVFDVRINTDFSGVIKACAMPMPDRPQTWINQDIIDVFCALHEKGHAHSVECWQDNVLVGGLYGLAIGQIFCGESMFSRASNASKIALVHLAARLHAGGFKVLDTQFTNAHLEQFDVFEIPHEAYIEQLRALADAPADFTLARRTEKDILQTYFAFRSG